MSTEFNFRFSDLGLGEYTEVAREDIQAAIDLNLIEEDQDGKLWITNKGVDWLEEEHENERSPYFEMYIQQDSRGYPTRRSLLKLVPDEP